MTSTLLITLGLIPSIFFSFVVLATFYGSKKAYVAISWVPLTFGLVTWTMRMLLAFGKASDQWWYELSVTITWASLVQAVLGIGLVAVAAYERKPVIALLIATLLSGCLFWLRLI